MIKVIAECCCNWTSLIEAVEMIQKAKDSGAWMVKFQLFTEKSADESKIPRYLALDYENAKILFDYGNYIGIPVFFTPMYPKAVDMCEKLGVGWYKIRYKDRYNMELISKIVDTGKPGIMSVDHFDISPTWRMNRPFYMHKFKLLYCVPEYPAKNPQYDNGFNYRFDGMSDHTPGLNILRSSIAFAGHKYFEKHVKLDGTTPLEDAWSVSFKDLKTVIEWEKTRTNHKNH